MPILTVTISKIFKNTLKSNKGFTIVEILVALSLIGLIFTLVANVSGSSREYLENSISKIERAIRFATNESILRNSIVRIHIDLDAEPVEYSIEYGQGADLVLPQTVDLSRLSIKERETQLKKMEKLDSQFIKVEEFQSSNELLDEGVSVYGLVTTYTPDIIDSGHANIYFYPTGERDSALIVFYNEQEVATLSVSPFEDRTQTEFYLLSETELNNMEYSLEVKSKEVVDKWLKD